MKHLLEEGHRSEGEKKKKKEINSLLSLQPSAFPLFKRKPVKLLSLLWDFELEQVDCVASTLFNHYTSHQTRSVSSRPYYSLPNSSHERRSVLAIAEPPRFHSQAKGKNVRLDAHSRKATRRNSFCNGVTFTNRPIHLYEKVRLKLVAVHHGWSGALRFGFTIHDPSQMSSEEIPKYACPDLVTRPGYWAKALPERFAVRDNILAFWVDRHGRVFYSINDEEPILFHCGIKVSGPLWALIDVYGITHEVQILDSMFAETMTTARLSTARLSTCLPQSNHDSANFNNNELENNQVVAKIANLNLSRVPGLGTDNHIIPCCPNRRQHAQGVPAFLDTDLRFHPTRGPDITFSQDRMVACTNWQESNRTLVFSDRPLHIGESLFVEVGHLGLPYYGALSFGITSCDPSTLRTNELPADPDFLLDRKEYWVVYRAFPVLNSGDILSFMVLPNGEVHHGVNGASRGMLMCVDTSQSLWVFFTIHGVINQLKILGTVQSSPVTVSPSGSPGGSQYDSDSDMAFSVNRSSSASESSLGKDSQPSWAASPARPAEGMGRKQCWEGFHGLQKGCAVVGSAPVWPAGPGHGLFPVLGTAEAVPRGLCPVLGVTRKTWRGWRVSRKGNGAGEGSGGAEGAGKGRKGAQGALVALHKSLAGGDSREGQALLPGNGDRMGGNSI
uniref:Neuralized E3 ubiquitin protein ligase 1B n=1 Tax=Cyanistes caeruleus TaxID=156563 RepID=A0A8C0VFV6_CYACU